MMKIIKAVIVLVLLVTACIIGNMLLNENMITQYKAENVHCEENKDAVNINTASLEELDSVKYIGEKISKAIAEYREEYGEFQNTEQIKNISGISDEIYSKIKYDITVKQEEK